MNAAAIAISLVALLVAVLAWFRSGVVLDAIRADMQEREKAEPERDPYKTF